MNPLKAEFFSGSARRGVRQTPAGLEGNRTHTVNCYGCHEQLVGTESDPWLTARRKTETLVLQPQGNEFYLQPVGLEDDPQARMIITALANTLISVQ